MKASAAILLVTLLGLAVSCANKGEVERIIEADYSELTLIGQVLLPGGFARRGMEVHATVIEPDGQFRDTWLLFNDKGHFSHAYRGKLESLTVSVGVSAEVFRVEGEDLPKINRSGQIDMGKIDLQDRVRNHRLMVGAEEGKEPGEVRVAMWFGLPPVGHNGGRVSLGSKQFPSMVLGNELDWLVPLEIESIYFLVERPSESGQGNGWWSGRQRLFGPFSSTDLPSELLMD